MSHASILAHDLRSPFTGLLGLFEAILQNPEVITEEEKDSMMLETYNSSSQLFKLLENLLNWSRTQTKNIDLKPQEIAIKELIDDIINLQQQTAKNKNIELLNEMEQNLNVFADINTLDTVFRNLISNAIKFTREGGKIKIKASMNNKTVKISVQDNGVGIPEEKLHKLFDIDEKTSTTGTNEESGTGLVLCKEFVELNNGNIFVESNIDQGSIFTVELPLNG